MKKAILWALPALAALSCAPQKKEEKNHVKQEVPATEILQTNTTFTDTVLTYPGSKISFRVSLNDKQLSITPSGLSATNTPVVHNITGYTIRMAETGDLNNDSYPEVFVYLTSDGSGSYGRLIGYSVNDGKSMSQVSLPEITDNPELSKGYMGHDEMAIVESTFCQRFPIYKEGDSNANPTGGMRQIQYKLTEGEACRILKVDKVIEF